MDFGFYKRARGMKHKAAATPFYPQKPALPAAPAQQPAGSKAKQPTAAKVRSVPAAVGVEVGGGNGVAPSGGGSGSSSSSDADVDRRAALYISRVQERLQRERMADDWRKYY